MPPRRLLALLAAAAASGAAAAAALAHAAAAAPISKSTLFGSAIKNGVLVAGVEQTTFEHNCSAPPCAITLMHVPSIYPDGNDSPACPWDWQAGRLRVYVDGEAAASVDVTLRQLAGVGSRAAVGNDAPGDGSPFGHELFGKTARTGGVYSTLRVPFGASVRTTIRGPDSCNQSSYFWFVIRGVENAPLLLPGGEFALPDQARLRTATVDNVSLPVEQELSIVATDAGTAGALAMTYVDAAGPDLSFLEGCVRLYTPGAAQPLFLSSGTEDFYLSASYWDEGVFNSPAAGCTWKDPNGAVSAYRTFARDPIFWAGGVNITMRNNEDACPQAWQLGGGGGGGGGAPRRHHHRVATGRADAPLAVVALDAAAAAAARSARLGNGPVALTTVVWYYAWPANAAALTYRGRPAADV